MIDAALIELFELADMYANKCTKQREKFDYYARNGIPWRWEDCEAAWQLLSERSDYLVLMDAWRHGKVKGHV